jgi:hypothetical protein
VNILIRKLIFNEANIHLILWNNKPCFFVSELSNALDSVNKEDISIFLRYGGSAAKGIDFDVVAGAEAKDLRKKLENSGIKKKFAHTMIIYFDGLRKYFNHRKTIESKDFTNYLLKCKVSLDSDSVDSITIDETPVTIQENIPEPIVVPSPQGEVIINNKPLASKKTTVNKKPKVSNKSASNNMPAASNKTEVSSKSEVANKPAVNSNSEVNNKAAVNDKSKVNNKSTNNKKNEITANPSNNSSNYSDFLKHISFMEEFVDTFNKLNIPADKSVAFTKSMAKFLESNGIQINDFLKELKKW